MNEKGKNIFLIILDSVRKDDIFDIIKKNSFPELSNDFVYFKRCNSIYTNTFLSHYAIFFGDYLSEAKNPCFPAQLRNLGYKNLSFCNYAVMTGYPTNNYSNQKSLLRTLPSITTMSNDLGITVQFNLKNHYFGRATEDYYGAADDIKNKIPDKWREFILKSNYKKIFMFLHFWKTHHNYGINEFLNEEINRKTYAEIAKDLIKKIVKKELTEKFVKKFYYNRINEAINVHIKDLIEILKSKNLYNDSLIIITADHGEGLGDIGYHCSKSFFFFYEIVNSIFYRIKNTIFSSLPLLRKIYCCKWDRNVFFHNGGYDFQKKIPLFIKFPKNLFGGITYNKDVSLFDIIHTINDFVGNTLVINNNLGCSLDYILKEGENAREKYKIKKSIQNSFKLNHYI
ncbi:MAG: sulfatase-like hydrolase/transferase [Promethearchaeota archaeon]